MQQTRSERGVRDQNTESPERARIRQAHRPGDPHNWPAQQRMIAKFSHQIYNLEVFEAVDSIENDLINKASLVLRSFVIATTSIPSDAADHQTLLQIAYYSQLYPPLPSSTMDLCRLRTMFHRAVTRHLSPKPQPTSCLYASTSPHPMPILILLSAVMQPGGDCMIGCRTDNSHECTAHSCCPNNLNSSKVLTLAITRICTCRNTPRLSAIASTETTSDMQTIPRLCRQ